MSEETTRLEVIASSLSELNDSIAHLSRDWDALRQDVRREVRQRTMALWVALLAAAIVILVMAAAGYVVGRNNHREIAENNRRWCPLVSLLVPRPGEPVPDTERGRIVAERATQLYVEFGCLPPLGNR
jgi:hypothetical protein